MTSCSGVSKPKLDSNSRLGLTFFGFLGSDCCFNSASTVVVLRFFGDGLTVSSSASSDSSNGSAGGGGDGEGEGNESGLKSSSSKKSSSNESAEMSLTFL